MSAGKLSTLHSRMGDCRLCLDAGYDIYPRAIVSGVVEARIMTIGQAPGITEKDAGRPFNAGSGTRLFQWLGKAGIDEKWFRETQYMTSVTKCFPGKSASGGGDRVPSKKEQALCRPYLDEEISIVDPLLIIPIGRLAIELFYSPRDKLTDIIGTKVRKGNSWVVPLPHPSGASRWPQLPRNKVLIDRAIEKIRFHYEALFLNP